jgi:hypothetical protein
MRCHPAIGSNPILCIIGILEDAKRESAGYLDCPESKDTIRINKVCRIKKINQNSVKPVPITYLDFNHGKYN